MTRPNAPRSKDPSGQNTGEMAVGPRGGKLMPPWQKGVSPNPGGRPSYKPLTEAYRRLLDMDPGDVERFVPSTVAEKIAKRLVKLAYDRGSLISAKELADRVEGRAAFAEEDRNALSGLTREEKRAQLGELLDLLGVVEVGQLPVAGIAAPPGRVGLPEAQGPAAEDPTARRPSGGDR